MTYQQLNMNKENKISTVHRCITIIFLVLSITTTAQQLYLETGMTSSFFDYKDSQGGSLDNLQATSHNFMTLGYRNQIFTKNLFGSLGGSYAGYGTIGSDDEFGSFMEWTLNYLEFNVGVDYEVFTLKKIKLYLKGNTSVGFLLQGTQTLNNSVFDLKNNDDFDKPLFIFRGGAGLSYPVSDKLSFYMQYMYGKSLALKDDGDDESLKIGSRNLSFGVLISLPKTVREKAIPHIEDSISE
jgi:hypothetical protein